MTYASNKKYDFRTQFGGWTRIDMLLAIYDKAIVAVRALELAHQNGDTAAQVQRLVEAQKCILAIHGGLKPDEHDVAFNIARLLNFILVKLEENEFDVAASFLEKLRESFAQIYDEAVQLEAQGHIPSMHNEANLSSLA